MFDLSSNQAIQLVIALAGGITLYVFGLTGLRTRLLQILVIIIPFQFLDSKYGSFNMAATYVLGISCVFGRKKSDHGHTMKWPLLIPICIVCLIYLLSWILAPKVFFIKNLFYLIMIGSNVFLFYIIYDYVLEEKNLNSFLKALIVGNILVIAYCAIQLFIGYGKFQVLGIEEFTFQQNRTDNRLVGPFNAAGITAEYLVVQCIFLGYMIMVKKWSKGLLIFLLFLNVAALIGTGNRGGFISFSIAFFLFIYSFRKELGFGKILGMSAIAITVTVLAATIMVKYTDFNVLFERMIGTRIDGVVPDTRSGWPYVLEKISEKPVIGHGPSIVIPDEVVDDFKEFPKTVIKFYPHNLYLYILYTIGSLGLCGFGLLGVGYLRKLWAAKKLEKSEKEFLRGFPRLGIIVFVVILIDQVKVEALRWYFLDFQHYLAAVFGMFVGVSSIIRFREKREVKYGRFKSCE